MFSFVAEESSIQSSVWIASPTYGCEQAWYLMWGAWTDNLTKALLMLADW